MDRLLDQVSPEQWDEWVAADALGLLGDHLARAEMRLIAANILSSLTGEEIDPALFRLDGLADTTDPDADCVSSACLEANLYRIAALQNAGF